MGPRRRRRVSRRQVPNLGAFRPSAELWPHPERGPGGPTAQQLGVGSLNAELPDLGVTRLNAEVWTRLKGIQVLLQSLKGLQVYLKTH